ncbi:MAG: PIG-L deacetylase family protein [Acidimicrobiales bacterium]
MTRPTTDLATPARALAVGAHPDDIEFGCGATLAKWAAAGCAIHHLVCTDGSKGSWDPDQDTAELVALRRQEQRAAAQALGGTSEVTFLRWTDGELEAGLRQRWELAYHIRRLRPEVVLGHDPWRRYRLHPDHRAAGFLVTDGIVAARDPHFFPEQGVSPHRPSTLLLWEADEPDHVEDGSSSVDKKLTALLAHRSQFRSTMGIGTGGDGGGDGHGEDDAVAAFRRRVEARMAEHGGLAGLALGESFKRIDEL